LDSITALLKAGNSADVIRQVIALKTGEWANDPTMEMYLRPKTLFNKTNFNNYVGSLGVSHEVS
jgi:Conserved phage C-terminus (Phg_2220_C).